jgi:hypothetical protein
MTTLHLGVVIIAEKTSLARAMSPWRKRGLAVG